MFKSLFNLQLCKLNSGRESNWKIDCDNLSDEDIECLAFLIDKMVSPFFHVTGVPRGGLRLAKALEKYKQSKGLHLFVDDVLTTGNTMCKFMSDFSNHVDKKFGDVHTGIVIFARGKCPQSIRPVFQMPINFW